MSATTTQVCNKRCKRNESYLVKKGITVSEAAVRNALYMECTCDPQCMYKVINQVDNAVQFVLDLRRKRFEGVIPYD